MRRILSSCITLLVLVGSTLPLASSERPGAERARRLATLLAEAERAQAAGKLEDAAAGYRAALSEAELDQRPTVLLARAIDGLANVTRDQERLEESAALFTRVVPLWERLLGTDQPRLAVTLHNLGVVRRDLGRLDDAEALLVRALGIWESSYGTDSTQAENTRRALRSVERLRDAR